ncbi:unnamed protein product [Rhizopus stolonifer]
MARITYSSMHISDNDNTLYFEVDFSKEKRNYRYIIKSFSVKAHQEPRLCHVTVVCLLLNYSSASHQTLHKAFFVHSINKNHPLRPTTISFWLRHYLRFSTSEERVSVRLISASLAFAKGIPKEGVATQGNWSTSKDFDERYQLEHLSTFDFINILLSHSGSVELV